MSIDGAWNCTTQSPMGAQKSVFTITTNGSEFTGTNIGSLGSMDVENGKVNGNTITWTMQMSVPMPMTLDCTATIDGDTLTGSVKAGMFGTLEMTGTRA